jgi:hypothetical protein
MWAFALLDSDDASRCAQEWAAHLHERILDGEQNAARMDRWRFVRFALVLGAVRYASRAADRAARGTRRIAWPLIAEVATLLTLLTAANAALSLGGMLVVIIALLILGPHRRTILASAGRGVSRFGQV